MKQLNFQQSFFDRLYYYLWQKDDLTKEGFYKVRIPETVVIKEQNPFMWFFTTPNDVKLLMRKVDEQCIANIVQRFSRLSDLDVVAQYVYKDEEKSQQLIINYITRSQLEPFLRGTDKYKNGILQQFIEPFGQHQMVIQAVWAPTICLISRRQSLQNIKMTTMDPYERCATFDGPEILSAQMKQVSKELSGSVRKTIENIVYRVSHASFEKLVITRGIFYLKCDKEQNLWFMYSNIVRFSDEFTREKVPHTGNNTPLDLDEYDKEHFKKTFTIDRIHPVKLFLNRKCDCCLKLCEATQTQKITFQELDKFHKNSNFIEQRYIVAEKAQHSIPKEVLRKTPRMNYQHYQKLLHSSSQPTLNYCTECYYVGLTSRRPNQESTARPKSTRIQFYTKGSNAHRQLFEQLQGKNQETIFPVQYATNDIRSSFSLRNSRQNSMEQIPTDKPITAHKTFGQLKDNYFTAVQSPFKKHHLRGSTSLSTISSTPLKFKVNI